jgi:16S rRNA (guanine1516-N2)-methyltransferase
MPNIVSKFISPASNIALCVAEGSNNAMLADCARRFGWIPIVSDHDRTSFDVVLEYQEGSWMLRSRLFPQAKPFYIDFLHGKYAYRRAHTSPSSEAIARAVGLKKGLRPRVLDMTAGLGFDAFVLASFGCDVVMVERSPVMAWLLMDGLVRLLSTSAKIPLRLSCIWSDARQYLARLPGDQQLDVIYLDPMYPKLERGSSSALVAQPMRLLRSLVGDDVDADVLLHCALGKARLRVVVKRPKSAPYLGAETPDFTIQSKDHRFDVYLSRATTASVCDETRK